MRTEDKNKYDSTILGLNNLYVVDNEGNYYINLPAIMATDKTIKRNNTYLLIVHSDKNSKMYPVILLDVYFEDGFVHLNVQDIRTQKKFAIDHCIECAETKCTWRLIDMDYLNELLDYKTIKSFCGKCDDPNGNSIAESKTKYSSDDLLELEF